MVKYADGPSTAVEIDVAAPAPTVWVLASDINTPARFSPEFQGAEWNEEGPALGATFKGHNKHERVGEWTTTSTITAYEDGRVFEWTVGDVENKTGRWRMEVEPTGDASCRLSFSAEMGPGPSGLKPMIEQMPDQEEAIVESRLGEWTRNMTATVEGIKDLAESR